MKIEDFPVLKKTYRVTMPDGTTWAVPVSEIAMNRATHFMHYYAGDLVNSLNEDTLPLFQNDESQIIEWAQGNMDWSDVMAVATRIENATDFDRYAAGWTSPKSTEVK